MKRNFDRISNVLDTLYKEYDGTNDELYRISDVFTGVVRFMMDHNLLTQDEYETLVQKNIHMAVDCINLYE